MPIRDACQDDIAALARIWHEGWQDAHAAILPEELRRDRTLARFRQRLGEALERIRIAEIEGRTAGFTLVREDELNQLYVTTAARGTGIAARLVEDALDRIRETGAATAWLACAIGNERAARFYEKTGWRRTGVVSSRLETADGPFSLDVWRYEIAL